MKRYSPIDSALNNLITTKYVIIGKCQPYQLWDGVLTPHILSPKGIGKMPTPLLMYFSIRQFCRSRTFWYMLDNELQCHLKTSIQRFKRSSHITGISVFCKSFMLLIFFDIHNLPFHHSLFNQRIPLLCSTDAFFAKPRKAIFNIFSIPAVHPVFQLRIPMVIYRHIWDFPFIPIIKDVHCYRRMNFRCQRPYAR